MLLDKNSAKTLAEIDPSRYTVYQMIDHIKDDLKIKPLLERTDDLYLFKTEPYIDSLYNFAHLLSENLTITDLKSIEDFYQGAGYRLKAIENENINNLLLSNGFKLKNTSYAMVISDLNAKDINYNLPENIEIIRSDVKDIAKDIKAVFVEAFNYLASDYDRKFGFLDQFKSDKKDQHIKSFVLYENGQAASTASYYAYDKFSIENVGTIMAARGKGYAKLMLKILLTEAKNLGYNEACLVSSEAALTVYQKVGFEALKKNNTYIK